MFYFLHIHFSVILAIPEEFQWENTQMKKTPDFLWSSQKSQERTANKTFYDIFVFNLTPIVKSLKFAYNPIPMLLYTNWQSGAWATCGFNSIMKPLKIKWDHLFQVANSTQATRKYYKNNCYDFALSVRNKLDLFWRKNSVEKGHNSADHL